MFEFRLESVVVWSCWELTTSKNPSKLHFFQTCLAMPAEKKARGRPTWVTGTKFIFLDQYAREWKQATDAGLAAAGSFYTKVAKLFIKKYGWFFDRWADKICPDPDVNALDDDDDDQAGLPNDEIEKRNKYFQELRSVSCVSPSIGMLILISRRSVSWRGFILTTPKSRKPAFSRWSNFSMT